MKKIVRIEGLDCPNCARGLEVEINKLKGIKNAKIDFLKSTLSFESEDVEKGLKDIISITAKLEPDAKIIEKNEKNGKKVDKKLIFDVIFLIFGISIAFIIFFVDMPKWLFWTLYALSAMTLGYKTFYKAVTQLFHGVINENLLITISVIGASFVSEHLEGLMVIALYSIGKIFEGLAISKSRKSIEALAKMQPEYVNLVSDEGIEERVSPSVVKCGDITLVRTGEKVAIDGIIIEGECLIDMQSLTGESVPVLVKSGDEILSGSIVLNGILKIKTTKVYEDSTISKIMNLVEVASEKKSKTETFISKITKWYTLGIVILAILVFGIVFGITSDLQSALYRGLIFLVISCPCAFAISVPLSYFSGLGNASKNGILIKGSNYLDACAKLNIVAFDKTGTLTTGQFEINKVVSFDSRFSEDDILFISAIGEQYSLHPLAKAICKSASKELPLLTDFHEKAGYGVEFMYQNHQYFVGRKSEGLQTTTVELFEDDVKVGEILLSDTVKSTACNLGEQLQKLGVSSMLLSGDNVQIAQAVADEVKIDEVYGGLLPQDKCALIEKQKGKKIAFVGDGINDAPSLMLADVGISMGINGSPASIEASDVVIVDDNPQKIVLLIKISRRTRKIVWQNIIISAIVKVLFLALGAVGITGMLVAVFADVGVTLLAILNSLRCLK